MNDSTPHRRYNPLNDEWVLVSPHRAKRPWQGQVESLADDVPAHDPSCFLCPGNRRSNGEDNPAYEGTFVFRNDFAALLPDAPTDADEVGLLKSHGVIGESHVICYAPRHDLSLGKLGVAAIERVVETWKDLDRELGAKYRWVEIFENRGAAMGASSPHPHGQVWAIDALPTLVAREDLAQRRYFEKSGRTLLGDYVAQEIEAQGRVVELNERWVWLVPFWAVWPFEVMLLPRRPIQRLSDLDADDRRLLAEILEKGLRRYDALFDCPFPYSMGWHGAPHDADDHAHWMLHAHFYPPLLRSATVRKFMVGFELLAESQRDITPEQAAERLRAV